MKGRRLRTIAMFALALVVAVGLAADAGAKKKKKKAKSGKNAITLTKTTAAAIPDYQAPLARPLNSQLVVPKAFKGRSVADVNVTVKTTGNVAGAANDLIARLSSPSGRTVGLFNLVGGAIASIGPFTLDDDTPILACNNANAATCTDTDPFATLPQPFNGRAAGFADGAFVALDRFYGTAMRGAWTLSIWDTSAGGLQTSQLSSWSLQVQATPAQ